MNDLKIRIDLAESNCRLGLDIRKRIFKEEHIITALSLQTLSSILIKNNIDEAECHIKKVMEIRLSSYI